jgi:MFS family permease
MEQLPRQLWHKRISISLLFFFYGLSYSSWASRIPNIQQTLQLSDASLGAVLLGMPIGSFLTLPFSGILVAKIGSHNVVRYATLLYCLMLICVGFSYTVLQLTIFLFLFGSCGNMVNISINTQALALENLYEKRIMSSFHGMWSVAGFFGATIGTFLMGKAFPVKWHFLLIAAAALLICIICTFYLIRDRPTEHGKRPLFTMPGKAFVSLGAIAFCSMMCSGAMFDWSGVYFKKVVNAKEAFIGLGYTAFMISMAATRFVADSVSNYIGFKKIIAVCGLLTASGLIIAVAFPYILPATIGLLLIGIGVSPVIPLIFSVAGKSTALAPGMAIAAVSTLGFVGLLIGPPMIGFIAGITSLKISFIILSVIGLTITFIASAIKR